MEDFTPGPWRVGERHGGRWIAVNRDYDTHPPILIAEVCTERNAAEANARLIARAPETERLCTLLATVAMNPAARDLLPFGLKEQVEAWLKS